MCDVGLLCAGPIVEGRSEPNLFVVVGILCTLFCVNHGYYGANDAADARADAEVC